MSRKFCIMICMLFIFSNAFMIQSVEADDLDSITGVLMFTADPTYEESGWPPMVYYVVDNMTIEHINSAEGCTNCHDYFLLDENNQLIECGSETSWISNPNNMPPLQGKYYYLSEITVYGEKGTIETYDDLWDRHETEKTIKIDSIELASESEYNGEDSNNDSNSENEKETNSYANVEYNSEYQRIDWVGRRETDKLNKNFTFTGVNTDNPLFVCDFWADSYISAWQIFGVRNKFYLSTSDGKYIGFTHTMDEDHVGDGNRGIRGDFFDGEELYNTSYIMVNDEENYTIKCYIKDKMGILEIGSDIEKVELSDKFSGAYNLFNFEVGGVKSADDHNGASGWLDNLYIHKESDNYYFYDFSQNPFNNSNFNIVSKNFTFDTYEEVITKDNEFIVPGFELVAMLIALSLLVLVLKKKY